MRHIFSILFCVVFLQSEVYALRGGPVYDSQVTSVNTVGTYAGIFTPTDGSALSNTIGIFTLGIPQTGLAGGIVYIFQEGATFQGNIQGVVSGDLANKFTGVIDAVRVVSFSKTTSGSTVGSFSLTYDATASGRVNSTIVLGATTGSAFRIEGTSDLTILYKQGSPELDAGKTSAQQSYVVNGYKQSATANVTTSNAVF